MSVRRQVHKLEQTVLLDTLTGIGNRRHMEIKLQSALGEFQQHRIPFGLAFADIDHFKRINDTFGHENGDRVLRMVATTLRQNLRADDTSARWGGEEFLILFYDIDQKGLEAASEKLRLLIEKSRLRAGLEQISITISIGATMARFEDDIVSILRRADTLMYKSKINGRNRVTIG
jgi:diguanylate cyclase (GGDEF)-like protein